MAERVPDPADDRAVLVALTPEGRRVGANLAAASQELWDHLLADWTPLERELLEAVWTKLNVDVADRFAEKLSPVQE